MCDGQGRNSVWEFLGAQCGWDEFSGEVWKRGSGLEAGTAVLWLRALSLVLIVEVPTPATHLPPYDLRQVTPLVFSHVTRSPWFLLWGTEYLS